MDAKNNQINIYIMDLQSYLEHRITEYENQNITDVPAQVVKEWMYNFNIGTQLLEDHTPSLCTCGLQEKTKFSLLINKIMDYDNQIRIKKNEISFAQKRLINAEDDKNQAVFHPDVSVPIADLIDRVNKWKFQITKLNSDLILLKQKAARIEMDFGLE
jgi:hypothetical protein